MIAARDTAKDDLTDFSNKLNQGVERFRARPDEAVKHITGTMHYSEADAREWMAGVRFADDVRGVDREMAERTVGILRKAGVLKGEVTDMKSIISIMR